MCGLLGLRRNCTGSAYVEMPLPNASKAYEYPAQLVWMVSVDGVTPLPEVLKTRKY